MQIGLMNSSKLAINYLCKFLIGKETITFYDEDEECQLKNLPAFLINCVSNQIYLLFFQRL